MPVFRLKPGGREPAPGTFGSRKIFCASCLFEAAGGVFMYLWTIEQFTHDIKHTWS